VVFTRRAIIVAAITGLACRKSESGPAPQESGPVTELEWHIQFLTNQQRNIHRLRQFEVSAGLSEVAREHSRDMLRRGYFDHRGSDGSTPRGRVERRGLDFALVAENIYSTADGGTDPADLASAMVAGWMKHEGHRRNILDPALKTLGVGVAISARRVLATQLFGG
jgi:uncharacterized protein YkwD